MRLDFSGRVVDLGTGRISTGGELRPMELRLVAYLAERMGQVVPQRELLREVWNYGPNVQTSTLYTTMYRLRSALEADPSQPKHLLTSPARGIRLVGVEGDTLETPTVLRELVGRSAALGRLQGTGLWVLVGPGGVGKTHLARELVRARAADGVPTWLCNVTAATTASEVAEAVSAALGSAGDVGAALASRGPAVLVLDGADHVDDLGPVVGGWARAAPEAQIVVTRCSPLGVGEHRVPVAPLAGPSSPDRLDGDAAELLLQRIRAVDAAFDPSEFAETVAELIAAVDGLPLALEIVAPYVATLGAASVLASVRAGGDFDDPREGRPARHRSLHRVLESTLDRLPEDGRRALSQLAAFADWFTPSMAAPVVVLPPEAPPLGRVLSQLVERGLLRVVVPGGDRFALLTAIRVWLGAPDRGAVERHREMYLACARRWVEAFDWVIDAPMDDEGPEALHAAHGALEEPSDPRWAALLVYTLRMSTRPAQAVVATSLGERLLRMDLAPLTRIHVMDWWATHLERNGRLTEAIEVARGLPDAALQEGQPFVAATLEIDFATWMFVVGRTDDAEAALARADRWSREIPEGANALHAQVRGGAHVVRAILNPTRHVWHFEQAVAELRTTGRQRALTHARAGLVEALVADGRSRDAVRQGEIALAEAPLYLVFLRVDLLSGLASALLDEGRTTDALARWDEVERLIDTRSLIGKRHALEVGRAEVLLSLGHFEEATRMATAGGASAQRHGSVRAALSAERVVATVARRTDSADQVDRLCSAFDAAAQQSAWDIAVLILRELVDAWIDRRSRLDPLRLTTSLLGRADLGVHRLRVALLHAELLRRTGHRHRALAVLVPEPGAAPDAITQVRLGRAALAAELGDTSEARRVLEEVPPAAPSAWTAVWRARCAAAIGLADEVRDTTRDVSPRRWEALLAAALEELRGSDRSDGSATNGWAMSAGS